jgi:hypothetical protein
MLGPLIRASARKHGISDDDMLHAIRNAIRFLEMDDLVMAIGPARDGTLLEIGIVRVAPAGGTMAIGPAHERSVRIVHAMRARPRFVE